MYQPLFMKKIAFVVLLSFLSMHLSAQNKIAPEDLNLIQEYEDTLGLLAFLIINDSIPENRFAVTKKMIPTLVKALKIKNSFDYPFEQLRAVSIQYPRDSSFRIFTWQLYVDVDNYRYYGAIQMNSPELELHPLIDRSGEVESEEHDILPPDKWFGALCYKVHQFDHPTGPHYLLFGFNGHNLFNKKKLIDVLHFKDGEAVFGAPVFIKENFFTGATATQNRVVLEYSSETSFRLNYDETFEMIMYDHLITTGGSYGQGMVSVPDGSYEGYRLGDDGMWHWVEKVFDQVSKDAPMPEPILDEKKKDLFGNK